MGTRLHVGWWAVTATAVAAACFLGGMSGCAVGRRDTDGAIVLGWEAGKLVETTNQGLVALGDMVLPGAGVGLLGVAGLAAKLFQAHGRASAAEAAKQAEDKAWEQAENERKLRDRDRALMALDPAKGAAVMAGVITPPVAATGSPT